MSHISIDGKLFEVRTGRNLLETCLALGFNLPYFCYHPAMGAVGACRQCAVKKFRDPNDLKGRIIMSCMEAVSNGLIISIEDPEAKAFRASIIEGLMLNHPHDCPVCDEGGECHLQDMTVMTGHNYRRNEFPKRTYKNQYLGPFISHEMNRCIQCYRCVRFYKDYAGGKDLNVFSAHDHVYFGRQEDGILESEFSGNLAEVCPTGVFTDKTHKQHFTRKWDLTNAPSVCTHCSVGCNILAGERYGTLRRIMTRYNGEVNGYFICDRGRFGYEFVNDKKRPRHVLVRSSKDAEPVAVQGDGIVSALLPALSGNGRILGIGSPRAPLEANFALSAMVGRENFFHGVSKNEYLLTRSALQIMQQGLAHSPSLKEIEKADAVLILGEDLTNTAPMVALAVRQASRNVPIEKAVRSGIPRWHDAAQRDIAQDEKSPVFIVVPFQTKLDDVAELAIHVSPSDIARLGFAVAHCIDPEMPEVPGLSAELQEHALRIGDALKAAKNPLIISGIHSGSEAILRAAADAAWSLSKPGRPCFLSLLFPECNSVGLGMLEGGDIDEAFARIAGGNADTMIILENDLYRRAGKDAVDQAFATCKNVIVLDHLVNETTLKADILLPVGTFAESEGTLVNNEGRAQRFYRVFPYDEAIPESWRRIMDMMMIAGKAMWEKWLTFDDVAASMIVANPGFEPIGRNIPTAGFRMFENKINRDTIRFSGRTANTAGEDVSEPKRPADPDSPLAFSMEGSAEVPPSSLVPYYWVPGWNSYQAMNFYLNEPGGHLRGGDPGVRLIPEPGGHKVPAFRVEPDADMIKTGTRLIIPVHRIFGSEELSSRAPAVGERLSQPFVLVNSMDAASMGVAENETVKLSVSGVSVEAILKTDDSIPGGIAGMPIGLPGMGFVDLPGYGEITKQAKPATP